MGTGLGKQSMARQVQVQTFCRCSEASLGRAPVFGPSVDRRLPAVRRMLLGIRCPKAFSKRADHSLTRCCVRAIPLHLGV